MEDRIICDDLERWAEDKGRELTFMSMSLVAKTAARLTIMAGEREGDTLCDRLQAEGDRPGEGSPLHEVEEEIGEGLSSLSGQAREILLAAVKVGCARHWDRSFSDNECKVAARALSDAAYGLLVN